MGLYNGSSINTTAAAMMFNQLWSKAAITIVRKDNGLLYAITGKTWNDTTPTTAMKQMKQIEGNRIECRVLGRLETPSGTADGGPELATVTPSWQQDYYGAMLFDLTHFTNTWGVPASEWQRIAGDESKTKSFIGDKFMEITLAYENLYGNSINASVNTGFTRTVMGNWQHAVSDGVSTGESTYGTYGTIDRTDAANIDFRGNVTANTGALTLTKIKQLKNTIRSKGGKARLLVAETTIYTNLESMVEGYAHVVYDEKWANYGSEYFAYSGMVGVQDHRSSAGVLGVLDPDTWAFWNNETGLVEEAFIIDPSRASAKVIPTSSWSGFFTNAPNRNGKFTGITN